MGRGKGRAQDRDVDKNVNRTRCDQDKMLTAHPIPKSFQSKLTWQFSPIELRLGLNIGCHRAHVVRM
jgi:hypothetical protein